MTGPNDKSPAKRRKILDQAMEVLRDTRAKIDPVLLALMKDRIDQSGITMPGMPAPAANAKKDVFSTSSVETLTVKKAVPPKAPAGQAAGVYAARQKVADEGPPKPTSPDSEPVDRAKIAAIVVEYMRQREEKKPGH